jgi:hypothetical protein
MILLLSFSKFAFFGKLRAFFFAFLVRCRHGGADGGEPIHRATLSTRSAGSARLAIHARTCLTPSAMRDETISIHHK